MQDHSLRANQLARGTHQAHGPSDSHDPMVGAFPPPRQPFELIRQASTARAQTSAQQVEDASTNRMRSASPDPGETEHCLEPKDWATSLCAADKTRHAPSRSRASAGLLANAIGAMTTDQPRSPDGLEQQPSEPESWQHPVLGMRSTATTSHALSTAQLKYKCTSTLLGRPLGQQLKRCCNRRWRAAQNLAPISVETDQNQLHMRLEGAITIGS